MNLEDLRRWHVKQSQDASNSLCCGSGSFEYQEARATENFHDNAAAVILSAMQGGSKMLDWNQKAQAINVLGKLHLEPESDGWFVDSELSVTNGHTIGRPFHRAATAEEAVLGLWRKLTDLDSSSYVVTDAADSDRRRHWRWVGFMWKEFRR